MVKINSDSSGILSIDLETYPNDKTNRTVVILSNGKLQSFLYNIVGNDVSSGKYLYMYNPSHEDYNILIYNQDKPVEYSNVDNFSLEKAVKGFELVESFHFASGCKMCSSKNMESLSDSGEMVSTCQDCDSKMKVLGTSEMGYDRYGKYGGYTSYKEGDVTFKPDSTLSDRERKYCSCILKVGSKGTAYNKYAVCAKSTGTTSRNCRANYDLENMPSVYREEALRKDKY